MIGRATAETTEPAAKALDRDAGHPGTAFDGARFGTGSRRIRSRAHRLSDAWRPSAVTGGAPWGPLAVLFGLNAVDELDRTAFAVLLPDIRDHFGLTDAAALSLVGVTAIAIVVVELPLSVLADRRSRVRITALGAGIWALFSFGTELVVSVAMLAAMRIGAGVGKAVVTPTHSSLLADYYAPSARVKVFAVHRVASSDRSFTPATNGPPRPLVRAGVRRPCRWRARPVHRSH